MKEFIFEIDYYNVPKYKQVVSGDSFFYTKTKGNRIVATLADGLGSGIKANVLSQLTASMTQKFMAADYDYLQTAQTILETLPVCSKRKISYSTFTSVKISPNGNTRILDYDNPELLWFRNNEYKPIILCNVDIDTPHTRKTVKYSKIKLEVGDRLILFSDGLIQSGITTKKFPLGWEIEYVKKFIINTVNKDENISARKLSKLLVDKALQNDNGKAHDDITCTVVYYKVARRVILVTGPPSTQEKDKYIVEKFKNFEGKKIIMGGTTSKIISKQLNEKIEIDLDDLHSDIPPASKMKSADIVAEGMLTLNKIISLLNGEPDDRIKGNDAAYKTCNMLLDSDIIHFLVGTAINPAHQNPNMPVEMGLRRISVNKIAEILENKFLKKVEVEYV